MLSAGQRDDDECGVITLHASFGSLLFDKADKLFWLSYSMKSFKGTAITALLVFKKPGC